MAYLAFLRLSLTFSLRMKHLTDQNWWQSDEAVAKEVLRQGRIRLHWKLYWLLGSSVQKQARRDGVEFSSPACKPRRVGVESDGVTSILMLERRYTHVME
jgi:hypothetical protein